MERQNTQQILAQLEELQDNQLPFGKNERTLRDVLQGEIAYAILYDNIRPNFVKDCYRLTGMEHEPNVLFIVQVDDFYEHYSRLPAARGYHLKSGIVKCIRNKIEQLGLSGFAANMVATTHIVCFLHIEAENEESTATIDRLFQIAEEFKRHIQEQTPYTATVGISDFCHNYRDFPTAYQEAQETLYRSFKIGRESIIFSHDTKEPEPTLVKPLDTMLAPLFQSIRNMDKQQYMVLISNIIEQYLRAAETRPYIKINMMMLVHELELYASRLGIDRAVLSTTTRDIIGQLVRCSFLTDMYQIMEDYFTFFTSQMKQVQANQESRFTQLVNGYLANHYSEPLDLRTLAQLCNYSAIHFGRLFKKIYGQNFSQYLTRYRLDRSIDLLCNTEQPIEAIAAQTGFNSVSYFCTTFKNHMGISPKKYREQYHLQHKQYQTQVLRTGTTDS